MSRPRGTYERMLCRGAKSPDELADLVGAQRSRDRGCARAEPILIALVME